MRTHGRTGNEAGSGRDSPGVHTYLETSPEFPYRVSPAAVVAAVLLATAVVVLVGVSLLVDSPIPRVSGAGVGTAVTPTRLDASQ